ncbi:MAG TPA: hypothetical protein ENN67_07545 [Firmicutes bacterium]|nr:hypothetical protein [Bacillota bacterium]
MSAKSRKIKVSDSKAGAPLWMVTYGDMMTLLLCFFILLFSFSTLDVVKFRDVIIELQGAFGVLSGGPMVLNLGDIPAKQITENMSSSTQGSMFQMQQAIQQEVKEAELENEIETEINERGLLIRFTDTVLFDLGKADIKPEAIPVLRAVANEIRTIPNQIAIEGHTDPTPIRTFQFPSNWWLSTGRACAILHWFVEEGGVNPEQLRAAGYSYYRPVAPNDNSRNRSRNRRVDVIILRSEDKQMSPGEILDYLESDESDRIVMTAVSPEGGGGQQDEMTDEPGEESVNQ